MTNLIKKESNYHKEDLCTAMGVFEFDEQGNPNADFILDTITNMSYETALQIPIKMLECAKDNIRGFLASAQVLDIPIEDKIRKKLIETFLLVDDYYQGLIYEDLPF